MKRNVFILMVMMTVFAGCETKPGPEGPVFEKKAMVIEFAPFSIKDGVTETMLIEASHLLQAEFAEKQRGFISRQLVKKSSKEYIDIVYWESQADADSAAFRAMNSTACSQYFQLMENADISDPSAGISHFKIVKDYTKNPI